MFKKKKPTDWVKVARSQFEKEARNPKKSSLNIFGIVFFTTLGLVFVLNIFKIIPFTIWGIIWHFWPLFFIIFILQLLFRKSAVMKRIAFGLGLGIIISVIFYSLASVNEDVNNLLSQISPKIKITRNYLGIDLGKQVSSQNVIKTSDYQNPKSRAIKTSVGLGTLNIIDEKSDNYFLSNAKYYENFGEPILTSSLAGGLLNIDFSTSQKIQTLVDAPEELNYNISIGQPQLPTKLEIRTQAGFINANLDDIALEELSIHLAAGTCNAKLGKNSVANTINIEVGAGTLTLNLPFDTFAEVKHEVGVGRLQVDGKNLPRTGTYTTPKFKITEEPVLINVILGTGVVKINTSNQID